MAVGGGVAAAGGSAATGPPSQTRASSSSGVLRAPPCRAPNAASSSTAGAPPPRTGGLTLRGSGSHCAAPSSKSPVAGATTSSSPKVASLGKLAPPQPGPPEPQSSRSSNGSTSSEPPPSRGHRFVRRVPTPTPSKNVGAAAGLQETSPTAIAGCGRVLGPPPSRGVAGSSVTPLYGGPIRRAPHSAGPSRCASPQAPQEGETPPWHWTPRTTSLLPSYTPAQSMTEVPTMGTTMAAAEIRCSTPTSCSALPSTPSNSGMAQSLIPPLPCFPAAPEAAHSALLAQTSVATGDSRMSVAESVATADSRMSVTEDAWQALAHSAKHLEEQKLELSHLVQSLRAQTGARAEDVQIGPRRARQAWSENGHLTATPPADCTAAIGSSGPPKSHRSARRIHAALQQALSENNVRPGEAEVAGPTQRLAAVRRTKELLQSPSDPKPPPSLPATSLWWNGDGSKRRDDYLELAGLIWQLVGGDACDEKERRLRGTSPPLAFSDRHGTDPCIGEPNTDSLGPFRGPFGGG